MQITSAMKMVSAAKLKKAQDAITQMRPYANKLTELLESLSATLECDIENVFSEQREVSKVLLVVITSNRGLCGGFNSSVVKESVKNIQENYKGKQVDILAIGKKGHDILIKKNKVIEKHNDVFDDLTFENVALIAERIMQLFANGNYDKVELIYNHFKNAATQITMVEQFLPIKLVQNDSNINVDYIFEPSKEAIVLQLIPKSLKTQLYKAVRDSFASEHGARMTAMHKATDNAKELRNDLLLTYNKARQAAITSEILEIVGGAEALNN
jgi:F-type H+-transporting ATPase subunit gamma